MKSRKKKKKPAPLHRKKKSVKTSKTRTSVAEKELGAQAEVDLEVEEEEFGEVELVDSVWTEMVAQAEQNPALSLLYERMQGDLKLIGLTGGIASGKSTLASHIRSMGIPVIDADEIAREVVQPGSPLLPTIATHLGQEALNPDGTLNRAKVAAIVFANEEKRKWLESVTHPEILRRIAEKIREIRASKNPRVIVIEAALLFESGLYQSMDKNILITAPEELRFQRLMQRGDISETEARQRMKAQMSDEEKETMADFIVDNSGDLEVAASALSNLLR